jgi:hypothetical protein
VHTPARQLSPTVHGFLSSHAVPSALTGFEHLPVSGSHTPTAWQASHAEQETKAVPRHAPARQVSLRVQAFLSSHGVPSTLAASPPHRPVLGLHAPAQWHPSDGSQVTGLPPLHTPAWQESVRVQGFLSSQPVPSGLLGVEQ